MTQDPEQTASSVLVGLIAAAQPNEKGHIVVPAQIYAEYDASPEVVAACATGALQESDDRWIGWRVRYDGAPSNTFRVFLPSDTPPPYPLKRFTS